MVGPAGGAPPAPGTKGTVLLVEEQQNVRTLLGKYLSDQNYAVLEAKDADEAIARCKEQKTPAISLMICDLVVGDVSGVELARRARTYHPRMRTVYTAAHSESSMLFRGIPLTDVSFLPKPFKMKDLIATVNELLGR